MFSLQKLLGKDDKFFDLLQASAEEGIHSVEALKRILTNPSATPTLDEFVASRRKDKAITNEIAEMALKDLYELLEKVFDRCRDAGNVISHVVLKHS
jgi:hypothetical protein